MPLGHPHDICPCVVVSHPTSFPANLLDLLLPMLFVIPVARNTMLAQAISGKVTICMCDACQIVVWNLANLASEYT